MKYLLPVVLALFSFGAFASENVMQEETIMLIEPSETAGVQKRADFPDCNNPQLVNVVREHIKSYIDSNDVGSVMDVRKRRLVLKNIGLYKELSVADFDSKENFLVANEIIMTKINFHVRDGNMRLCVGEGEKPVYLLIYPEDFRYVVQIINFIPPVNGKNNFSVWYVPEVKKYDSLEEQK